MELARVLNRPPRSRPSTNVGLSNQGGYGSVRPGEGDADPHGTYWGGTRGFYTQNAGGGGYPTTGYLGTYSNIDKYVDPRTIPGYVYKYSPGADPLYSFESPYGSSPFVRTSIPYSNLESFGVYRSSNRRNNLSAPVGFTPSFGSDISVPGVCSSYTYK